MTAQYTIQGMVAVITLDNPPVNSLGLSTRQAICTHIAAANQDETIKAIVITGAGKAFCGGADITEFGTPKALQEPNLLSVISVVENSNKPVIAAINATAMGGGLELALGCHYRLVQAGVKVALPEVKLGLIPGAGGTQRLPRAIGIENALNMMISGEPGAVELLAAIPNQTLFNKVLEEDEELLVFANHFATMIQAARPLPKLSLLSVQHDNADGYFQFARNTIRATAKHYPAPIKCVDAVESSLKKSFALGMAHEQELFVALMMTPESRALRHAFFAERGCSKIIDVPESTPKRSIKTVGIVGAGMMGGGIAMNFLNVGIPVVLLETSQAALDRGLNILRGNYAAQVAKGKLKQPVFDERMALLSSTLDYNAFKTVDLVIEAVFEEISVKESVFKQLDAVCKPGTILASNTSTLDLNTIANCTKRPQDVVGLHFFSPANVMKLLEVVRATATSHEVLATVMALAKTIKKTAVVSGVCDGFIGNRMLDPYARQAGYLLDEGCTPQQVDKAIENFGFMMGPFRMWDMAGNDIAWAIRKRRAVEQPHIRYSKTADLLCEMGRMGQKTNAGWYDYQEGKREAIPNTEVEAMIIKHRESLGITPRKISDEEIVQRLVLALVNEGAYILEEGIASKASDIDMVYLTGYGFPIFRGGPMKYADELGLFNVIQAMNQFANQSLESAEYWQPAPLLLQLAKEGKTFSPLR
jgi:3-hydroxyacyl-CoA dehydrogenase